MSVIKLMYRDVGSHRPGFEEEKSRFRKGHEKEVRGKKNSVGSLMMQQRVRGGEMSIYRRLTCAIGADQRIANHYN